MENAEQKFSDLKTFLHNNLFGVENNKFVLNNETVKVFDNQVLVDSKAYTDEKIGDIDTALNSIIAMQNELIGGGEV